MNPIKMIYMFVKVASCHVGLHCWKWHQVDWDRLGPFAATCKQCNGCGYKKWTVKKEA